MGRVVSTPASRLDARILVMVLVVVFTMASDVAVPAAVQDPELDYQLFDQVSLVLGFGWAGFSTDVRLDSTRFARLGTEISFEKDLGLSSDETIPALQVEWMVARRHTLVAMYASAGRDATRQVAKDISFGELLIPINETVSASFDQEELSLAYLYWPIRQPRYALGLGMGARLVRVTASLEILGRELSEEGDLSAPLPFIDLQFRYCITPKTRLTADFGLLTAEIGDYDGLHAVIGAKVEHLTWAHFGFGAGLNWQKAKVDTRQESFTGTVRMESVLVQLFARARW